MSVISGFHAENPVYGYARLYLTGDLDDYADDWINSIVSWLSAHAESAALVMHWPVSTTPFVRSGAIATSYFDDYYNRIHITPRVLDIGNLISVQTREVSVWNAWTVSQALSAITETGTEGLTESGITAPSTFAPLQEQFFDISVETNGPSSIGAEYVFVFPSEAPTLEVTGSRIVVFGHPPNWAQPVVEKLSWLTDVMIAQGGIEQRAGLRDAPRRALAYALTTEDRHQSNLLETAILGWQSRVWAVPVWTDVQVLGADLAASSLTIPCETASYEFSAGGLALLWRAHDQYEAVEVQSVGASSLTLVSSTVALWPAGTRLYPIRLGRMPARQPLTRLTGHHLSGNVEFSFSDNPPLTALDSGDLYDGFRVYGSRSNWVDAIETEFVRQLDEIDYETGRAWRDDLSGLAALLKSWHWTFATREEITAFRAWLSARAGRCTPFWSVSHAIDMEISAPIGAFDTAITIRNIGYQRYLDGRIDRRHLVIRTVAGATHYRRITGSAEIDAANETLSIDSALGITMQPGEVESVQFMHLTRLENDAIEIAWHSTEVALSSAMLRSLPQ